MIPSPTTQDLKSKQNSSRKHRQMKTLGKAKTTNIWDVIDHQPELRKKLNEKKSKKAAKTVPKKPVPKTGFESLLKTHKALENVVERKESINRVLKELRPATKKKVKIPKVSTERSLSPLHFTKSFQELFTRLQQTTGKAVVDSVSKSVQVSDSLGKSLDRPISVAKEPLVDLPTVPVSSPFLKMSRDVQGPMDIKEIQPLEHHKLEQHHLESVQPLQVPQQQAVPVPAPILTAPVLLTEQLPPTVPQTQETNDSPLMEIISSLKKDPIQKPALKPSTLNPSEKDPLSSFSRLSINGKETLKPPQIEYRLSVQSNRNSAYEQNLAKLANEFQNEFGSEAVLDVVPSLVVNSARCSVPGPSDGPTLVVPPLSEPIHAVQPLPLSESNPVAVQTLLESNPLPKTAEPLSPTKSQPDPAQQTITNFAQNLQKSPSLLRIFVSTTHGLPSTQQADILHHGAKLESKILELMTLYNTFINELGTPKLT